jgi:hypothetical protein
MTFLLLAFLTLTAPPDAPVGAAACLSPDVLGDAAVELQLLDPRERRYFFHKSIYLSADLNILRGRFRELGTAPLVQEYERLPDYLTLLVFLANNRAYRSTLVERLKLESVRRAELEAAVEETDQLYKIWDAMRDARCPYYYLTVRRQGLQRLRDLLGPTAYYGSVFPPPVPLWRIPVLPAERKRP